jgi:hypothetical protein
MQNYSWSGYDYALAPAATKVYAGAIIHAGHHSGSHAMARSEGVNADLEIPETAPVS